MHGSFHSLSWSVSCESTKFVIIKPANVVLKSPVLRNIPVFEVLTCMQDQEMEVSWRGGRVT